MSTTLKTAQSRMYQFLQASRALPPLPSFKRSKPCRGGPIVLSQWGARWSRLYRKRMPELAELYDTLDRLREEHRLLNAQERETTGFKRELRRLAKL